MSIPSQRYTIQDPGLGVTLPAVTTPLFVGVGSGGTQAANTVGFVNSRQQVIDRIGYGPLASALSREIGVGGGPVLFLRTSATVAASNSAVAQSGGGPLIALSAAPFDSYEGILEIVAGGLLGAATFRYSLDGGQTYGPVRDVPSGGIYAGAAAKTGLTVTFPAGPYAAGETYTWTSTPAMYNGGDITTAFAALLATSSPFATLHFCGEFDNATTAATMFAIISAEMTTLENNFKFARAFQQAGNSDVSNPASAIAAFSAASSTRVGAVYSTARRPDALGVEGFSLPSLPAADVVASRIASTLVSTDPKRVRSGPLVGVTAIGHNEFEDNAGMDAAGFTTLRTWQDTAGFFVTQGRMMAPAGSDYEFVTRGRVMDVALRQTYIAQARFIGRSVRVVSDPVGAIDPRDAAALEAEVLSQLRPALLAPVNAEGTSGFVSEVKYVIDRDNNVLATNTILATLSIRPLGYIDFVDTIVGYVAAL